MRNARQRRISLREEGKRRVRRVTQAIAVAGGALAAMLGIAFGEDAFAASPESPATTGSTQSPDPTTVAPSTPDTGGDNAQTTAPAPALQPPAELPRSLYGGSGHVRSRSTP